jgi:hypothetical protein
MRAAARTGSIPLPGGETGVSLTALGRRNHDLPCSAVLGVRPPFRSPTSRPQGVNQPHQERSKRRGAIGYALGVLSPIETRSIRPSPPSSPNALSLLQLLDAVCRLSSQNLPYPTKAYACTLGVM